MCVDLNILRFIFSILQFKDIIHQIWTFCNLYFQIAQNIIHQMFSDKFFPLSGKQSEDDADDPERRDQIWAYWALILHQLEKNSAWNQLKKATSGSLNHLTFFLSYTAAWQTLTWQLFLWSCLWNLFVSADNSKNDDCWILWLRSRLFPSHIYKWALLSPSTSSD